MRPSSSPLTTRTKDIQRFYTLLDRLTEVVGRPRLVVNCNGRQVWPDRGVYFIFEPGGEGCESGGGLRVVRVGTHAIQPPYTSTLWNRLSNHRGTKNPLGGNHRQSVL